MSVGVCTCVMATRLEYNILLLVFCLFGLDTMYILTSISIS